MHQSNLDAFSNRKHIKKDQKLNEQDFSNFLQLKKIALQIEDKSINAEILLQQLLLQVYFDRNIV